MEDDDAGSGSLVHLQNLFRQDAPAPAPDSPIGGGLQRKRTQKGSNTTSSRQESSERTALLGNGNHRQTDSFVPILGNGNHRQTDSFVPTNAHMSTPSYDSSALSELFQSPSSQKTPKIAPGRKFATPLPIVSLNQSNGYDSVTKSVPEEDEPCSSEKEESFQKRTIDFCSQVGKELLSPNTWIGAGMFVLYHTVFSLAFGSSGKERTVEDYALASFAGGSHPWMFLPIPPFVSKSFQQTIRQELNPRIDDQDGCPWNFWGRSSLPVQYRE